MPTIIRESLKPFLKSSPELYQKKPAPDARLPKNCEEYVHYFSFVENGEICGHKHMHVRTAEKCGSGRDGCVKIVSECRVSMSYELEDI